MEALLNLQGMTPHQRDGGFICRHEWHRLPSFIGSHLTQDGAEIRHCYRKGCVLSRTFSSLWLGFRKKSTNNSFVCVCHGLLELLRGTRKNPQKNKKTFEQLKKALRLIRTFPRVLSCLNKRVAFRRMRMITAYPTSVPQEIITSMPVWDPYRYLALLLMHTKMQTHSFFF